MVFYFKQSYGYNGKYKTAMLLVMLAGAIVVKCL